MTQEIIRAFLLIFIAEMGDKTQILAMAFATRYPVRKVLVGIGIGAFLNHGLAVMLGSFLGNVIPLNTLQMVAGAAFIGFALWTLKSEDEEEEEDQASLKFGPVATVALAFFVGELGDKTQLAAITLAADATYPYLILVGTIAGMIATGGLGIIVGKKMGDRIPEIGIKLFAAAVFLFFGLQKLYQTVPSSLLSPIYIIPFMILLILLVFLMVRHLFKVREQGIQSEFLHYSKKIHDYNTHIEINLMDLDSQSSLEEDQAIKGLADTLYMMNHVDNPADLKDALPLLRELEYRLLGRYLKSDHDITTYFDELGALSPSLSQKAAKAYRLRHPIQDRIFNLGDERDNIYLFEVEDGYVMIDTGHEHQYDRFLKALDQASIQLNDIAYIFITHAHHVGFLSQLLNQTKAQVILHPLAAERIKSGTDQTDIHYTNQLSRAYYFWLQLTGRSHGKPQPVDSPERYLLVTESTRSDLEKALMAKIIDLPGHSKDSIGLLMTDRTFFCGDALMNRAANRNLMAMRLEDLEDYKSTWHKMLDLDYKTIYPSHGKPFAKSQLLKYKDKLVWDRY